MRAPRQATLSALSALALLCGCPGAAKYDSSADNTPDAPASSLTVSSPLIVAEGAAGSLAAAALNAAGPVSWSFGDGAAAEGAEVAHTWAAAGNYTAIAEVQGADGRRLTASARVEVFRPPADPAPVRSGSMALDAHGRVWAVTPEADTLAVVDATGAAYVPTCDEPQSVAVMGAWGGGGDSGDTGGGAGDASISAAGTIAAACLDGQIRFWQVEPGSRSAGAQDVVVTEIATYDAGTGARAVAITGRGGVWWVSLQGTGGLLTLTEGEGGITEDRRAVGPDPGGIAVGTDIYVARFRSDPGGGAIYRSGAGPITLPVHPGPDSDTVAGGVPTLIANLALSPDAQTLYIPALQANIRRGLLGTGQPLTFESSVRAALGVVDVRADSEDWSVRKQLDNQDRVIAAAPNPTGNFLAVAHPGTATIQILDAFRLDAVGSIHDAGEGVRGLIWAADPAGAGTGILYVHAWLDREVRAYAMGEPGRMPELLWTQPIVAAEPLAPEVLRGKILFHTSRDPRISSDGYISCAGCHPDGDQDGLTWDFTSRGEGMRNTVSLLGRGDGTTATAMGWIHWSANFDEAQDFENDIRDAFGGTGLLSDADWAETSDTLGPPKAGRSADLDALAAFMASLTAAPASPSAAAATPERAALFAAAGCDGCHPAPRYTDSALDALRLHDVGTLTPESGGRRGGALTGLDTPTLLGAQASGPWLHDGSAATLDEAIRRHAGAEIPALTEEEIAELALFVGAL